MTRLRASGLAGLAWVEGALFAAAAGSWLSEHDVPVFPSMHGYSGVAGGGAAVVVMGFTVIVATLLGLALAAIVAARAKEPFIGAALGLQFGNVAQLTLDPSAGFAGLLLVTGVLIAVAGKKPVLVIAGLPALSLVALLAISVPGMREAAARAGLEKANTQLTQALTTGDRPALDALLKKGPVFVDWALWDAVIDPNVSRESVRAVLSSTSIELTPCAQQLRAVGTPSFPPDAAFMKADEPISWRCRDATAMWAATLGDRRALAALFEGQPTLVSSTVATVLRTHRFELLEPVLRSGLLGTDGKLRPDLYTADFMQQTLYHNDGVDQWAALMPYLDRTRALLALLRGGHDWLAQRLVVAGADVNGTDACGTTPLVALARHGDLYSTLLLAAMLDAGANVTRAAPPDCDGGADTVLGFALEGSPSWEFVQLLGAHGAQRDPRFEEARGRLEPRAEEPAEPEPDDPATP